VIICEPNSDEEYQFRQIHGIPLPRNGRRRGGRRNFRLNPYAGGFQGFDDDDEPSYRDCRTEEEYMI
jgi:hypothetical protein